MRLQRWDETQSNGGAYVGQAYVGLGLPHRVVFEFGVSGLSVGEYFTNKVHRSLDR